MEIRKDDLRRKLIAVCRGAIMGQPGWQIMFAQNGMIQLRVALPNGSYKFFEIRVSEKQK